MTLKKFLSECRDHDVFKNLSIYIVSGWVLLQVVDLIAGPVGLPEATLTYLLIVLLVGFPVYLYMLWRFVLKDKIGQAPRLSQEGNTMPGPLVKSAFHKIYFSFLGAISLIALSVVILVIDKKTDKELTAQTVLPKVIASDKIAVLKFDNNTGDASNDIIGKMVADWIMHGITENQLGQVISPKIVEEYAQILKASMLPRGENGVLKEYFKPSKVIGGSYYLNKNKLLIQCSVLNGSLNKNLISFEVTECDADAPLDCIEALKQEILGYFLSEGDVQIAAEDSPPNFKAYQLWLEAEEALGQPNYLKLINEAIAADDTYFKPKIDRILHYYNRDEFAVADSLLGALSQGVGTNKQQINMLKHLEACLKGDNKTAYRTYLEEYNIAPIDKERNSSAMVLALQFVNRPQDIDSLYAAMDMTDIELDNCVQCGYRYYIKGMADIELGRAKEAIALLEPFSRSQGHLFIKSALIKAYIKEGDTAGVKEVMDYVQLLGVSDDWEQGMLNTGIEFLKNDNKEAAEAYLEALLTYYEGQGKALERTQRKRQAEASFVKGDYRMAEKRYGVLLAEGPLGESEMAYLAIAQYRNGKEKMALETVARLDAMRAKYQFGSVDYALAQYDVMTGDREQAMDHLLKAVAAGKRFTNGSFQNDLVFKPYWKNADFQKILEFWHD